MGPRGPSGPRSYALYAVLGALVCGLWPAAAAMAASDERRSASPVAATPCWRVEDFVVAQECTRCSSFQAVSTGSDGAALTPSGAGPAPVWPLTDSSWSQKTIAECSPTGFIEKISCATSKRDEFKSCRSAVMEARVFWRFVGTMMCVATIFAVLVVCRQRVLDRKALEKVRKQIESI
ncbi:protein JTB isoform X2 [Haliaeetus albicilla]|uniref:protein JTB isoform X2 n=1 Tax=Haliaeetus albicilla TaxID=8969 RepID=UPI0037E90ECF